MAKTKRIPQPKVKRKNVDQSSNPPPKACQQDADRSSSDNNNNNNNKPRNHLILHATEPFEFEYTRFGSKTKLVIHQTPEEETWPGGALWDLGVILAKVLVLWRRGSYENHHPLPEALGRIGDQIPWKEAVVLELGCGVGLTGLVAAALGAKLTVLTDLEVVTSKVTEKNVACNASVGPTKTCGYRVTKAGGKVLAMPLCWGNEADEEATRNRIAELTKTKTRTRKSKQSSSDNRVYPDLIIIGDVAYQHKPGAPSHFDVLLSTLQKFVGPNSKVIFGTRMRMPASQDLLELFRQHLHEEVQVEAHDLDPSLAQIGRKHNMSVHILRKK